MVDIEYSAGTFLIHVGVGFVKVGGVVGTFATGWTVTLSPVPASLLLLLLLPLLVVVVETGGSGGARWFISETVGRNWTWIRLVPHVGYTGIPKIIV